MNEKNKLELLLDEVTKLEDKYYEFSDNAIDRGDMNAMQLMSAQATTFQRVRYMIEELLENEI